MTKSPWRRRIERANILRERHSFAGEILGFYVRIASFQEDLHQDLNGTLGRTGDGSFSGLSSAAASELVSIFGSFLSTIEKYGPTALVEVSKNLRTRGQPSLAQLLSDAWLQPAPLDAETILVQALLQPYAEWLRSRAPVSETQQKYAVCRFCNRKPSFGVLRQMGEGASRSMVCGFCLAEWDFRRIVCPSCGEENDARLSVFTAKDWDYIRVECCESCKTYVKTIDLTKDGHAEPIVDELASAPLDLWARERGYAKLHGNMLGM